MSAMADNLAEKHARGGRHLDTLAGIIAGPLCLAVVALLTRAELGYLHDLGWRFTGDDKVPWPSGLALGDYGAVLVLNFAVTGALLFIFVRSFREALPPRRSGRIAGALLTLWTLAFTALAFPTDHASLVGDMPNTWHGWAHGVAFVTVMLASIAAPIAVAVALRGNDRWRGFPALSIGAAIAAVAFLVIPLGDPGFVVFLVVIFGWFVALATRLRAQKTSTHA